MNVTGNTTLEYLSIRFTSLIFGMETFRAEAPFFRAWKTFGRCTDFPATLGCKPWKPLQAKNTTISSVAEPSSPMIQAIAGVPRNPEAGWELWWVDFAVRVRFRALTIADWWDGRHSYVLQFYYVFVVAVVLFRFGSYWKQKSKFWSSSTTAY